MKRRASRVGRVALAVGALAVTAAACGSDDDATTTTAGGTPTTAGPTDGPTTTGEPVVMETLKLGVAWADLSAFVAINPAYGTGDPEEQALAVLEAWHRDGLLPINGYDVEFVTKSYSAIDGDQKLQVCQEFGNEGDIFAVIGGRDFTAGAECLATRFQIPVIDTNQTTVSMLDSTAPYMFTLKPTDVDIATSFANWAVDSGKVDGKKVGIYFESQSADARDAIMDVFDDADVEVVSEIESGGLGSVGAEQDPLAAEKLKADGADLVIFLVGSSSIVNVLSTASDQGYTPEFLDMDWASHLSNVAAGAYNQDLWEGTRALASITVGDMQGGLSDAAESCLSNYEEFSGKTINREVEESGEFSNILITCDLASVFYEALKIASAAGEVTQDSFIAAVEQVSGLSGAYWDSLSFSADDHTGADTVREVVWDKSCTCWMKDGEFGPIADYL